MSTKFLGKEELKYKSVITSMDRQITHTILPRSSSNVLHLTSNVLGACPLRELIARSELKKNERIPGSLVPICVVNLARQFLYINSQDSTKTKQ